MRILMNVKIPNLEKAGLDQLAKQWAPLLPTTVE